MQQQSSYHHPKTVDLIIEEVKMHLVHFFSSLKDWIALSQTCRGLSIKLGETNMTNVILNHNLSKQLARFNLTTEDLHRVFRKNTGAVLSGSTVLQVFRGVRWANTDLDIYLPYRAEVEKFLQTTLSNAAHGADNDNDYYAPDDDDGSTTTTYNSNDSYYSTDEDVFLFEEEGAVNNMELILEFFGLPQDGRYSKAKLIYSTYFPIHFKYMLELVQKSGKKIQLIFVLMDFYTFPQQLSCGFVVDFFDLSIVMNYYDGTHYRSRFPQHVFSKEMTINIGVACVSEVTELQLCRLMKYVGRRGFKFMGPFLPLSQNARQTYDRYIDKCMFDQVPPRFEYPIVNLPTVQQEPSIALIRGEWMHAAALADGCLFSDSDSDKDGEDLFRGFWRRQRRTAFEYRKAGLPELEWEQQLQEKMPSIYSLHRGIQQAPRGTTDTKDPAVLWSTNTMSLTDAMLSVRFNMREFPRNRMGAITVTDLFKHNNYDDDDEPLGTTSSSYTYGDMSAKPTEEEQEQGDQQERIHHN